MLKYYVFTVTLLTVCIKECRQFKTVLRTISNVFLLFLVSSTEIRKISDYARALAATCVSFRAYNST